jgi:heme/copper-type cytochrome/quinol oxidase subunit 1
MVTTFVFFLLGGVEATVSACSWGPRTPVSPQVYNQLFTMHGRR